ncbi:hypothetical protein EAE99_011263 [Botrytis elliptica]|nr:hypothetical protein EAE99_011263 [Botrytis elliptica]
MQAPADIRTPSENPPKRELATSTQDSTNPTDSQTRARNDFWEIVMQTSENKPSSEKVLRNNSSGITARKANSISQKKHSRKELWVATVQNCAFSPSSRKGPRRDFWALCSE